MFSFLAMEPLLKIIFTLKSQIKFIYYTPSNHIKLYLNTPSTFFEDERRILPKDVNGDSLT